MENIVLDVILLSMVLNEGVSLREKHTYMTTPGGYQKIPLSPFCILPNKEGAIRFEVKASKDVMFNMVTEDVFTSTYYQIVIGGFENQVGKIRRKTPSSQGEKVNNFVANLLNETEYRQFWISWHDGHIQAGRGLQLYDDMFMEWFDPVPLNIKALYAQTKHASEWIFHEIKQNPIQYEKTLDMRLNVGIFEMINVDSVMDCAKLCYHNIYCSGFNFKQTSGECELVEGSITNIESNLDFDYYTIC